MPMKHIEERDLVASQNEEALFVDGHDNALIGVGQRCGQLALAVYDNALIRANLMSMGMDETDAIEYFEFNILGGWLGEHTPIFMEPLTLVDEKQLILRLRMENARLKYKLAEYENREH
jgi:hypothetical protein